MALELKAWRQARKFTQEQMAERLGIHANTYGKYERNPSEITMAMAYKISECLNVDIDDIIFMPETATNLLN